jgi:hypothetical protein
VFVGLSVANVVLTGEMVAKHGQLSPMIFAMANPDPEIPYEVAQGQARPDCHRRDRSVSDLSEPDQQRAGVSRSSSAERSTAARAPRSPKR